MHRRHLPLLILAPALALLALSEGRAQERVSAFGRYSGYTEANYDGSARRAEYVAMPDGVELAVEYFVPTNGGQEATEPLPAILVYTRYLRSWEEDGRVVSDFADRSIFRTLIGHGYVLVVANARGSGASFGTRQGEFSHEETMDAYEVVEWIAGRDWCDGHVGMWGRSYSGMTGLHAAATAPPHLDAVFSEMAGPILYDFAFQGGTFKHEFLRTWSGIVKWMDLGRVADPARMDSDPDGTRRDAAVAGHRGNLWPWPVSKQGQYRDWVRETRNGDVWGWDVTSSIDEAAAIRASGIPIYHWQGWYDMYVTQQAIGYENFRNRKRHKLTIGPWTHGGGFGSEVHRAEILRWFDHHLKGVANGVTKERPIHYHLMRGNHTVPEEAGPRESADEIEAGRGEGWRAATKWPAKMAKARKYYFTGGTSGTVGSVNDGGLSRNRPEVASARDEYRVDLTSTTGSYSRWMDGYGRTRDDRPGTTFFDERTAEDEKALTYTSEPMASDMAVVGHPVVHLWVGSTHSDGDFFVLLEEIDETGRSHYVTEGMLRASHRALGEAPWRNLGLPFHPSTRESRADLPDHPVELVFDLMATAIVIDRGHRIRVTVAGADRLNHQRYPARKRAKAPRITVERNADHPSHVELPMMAPR